MSNKSKKVGIIVDGDGDYASLKARFKGQYKILKTDGPRGDATSINDIISKSRKQVSMLKTLNCTKAIIVTDFENRRGSYNKFYSDIMRAFDAVNFGMPIFISVPNKMIENWYLADIEYLSKKKLYLKDNLRQRRYEGTDGKRELKKLFKYKYTYNEIKHGKELFTILRFINARRNSDSLNNFLDLIGKK